MVSIDWRAFLTGRDDPTISNVSFLSNPREKHAVAVGIIAGVTGSKTAIVGLCLYLLGRESKAVAELPESLHLRDALREPGYALLGVGIGVGLHVLAWSVPGWVSAVV